MLKPLYISDKLQVLMLKLLYNTLKADSLDTNASSTNGSFVPKCFDYVQKAIML